jgi:hypothetical protein
MRVDHDISLLIPEIWARLHPEQRDPAFLIEHGHLEQLHDFEHNGKQVLASRLGYRITDHFVHGFIGKIFDNPSAVFTEAIMKPETQDLEIFVDGINNIVEAQQRVAQGYIDDGSIEDACPPLQALLQIMARGEYRGMDAQHPNFRAMFTREYLLESDWYRERLEVKQQRDIDLWTRHVNSLMTFIDDVAYADVARRLDVTDRFARASEKLEHVRSREYLQELVGTLGADPLKPARVSDSRVINWARARLAATSAAAQRTDALQAQGELSLLQRFKSRFTRSRAS